VSIPVENAVRAPNARKLARQLLVEIPQCSYGEGIHDLLSLQSGDAVLYLRVHRQSIRECITREVTEREMQPRKRLSNLRLRSQRCGRHDVGPQSQVVAIPPVRSGVALSSGWHDRSPILRSVCRDDYFARQPRSRIGARPRNPRRHPCNDWRRR
jgi:hypothetical protein